MTSATAMQHISIRISREMKSSVDAACEDARIAFADFIRAAIREKLEGADGTREHIEAAVEPMVVTLERLQRRLDKMAVAQQTVVAQQDMQAKLFLRYFAEPVGRDAEEALRTIGERYERYNAAVAESLNGLLATARSTNGRAKEKNEEHD